MTIEQARHAADLLRGFIDDLAGAAKAATEAAAARVAGLERQLGEAQARNSELAAENDALRKRVAEVEGTDEFKAKRRADLTRRRAEAAKQLADHDAALRELGS